MHPEGGGKQTITISAKSKGLPKWKDQGGNIQREALQLGNERHANPC